MITAVGTTTYEYRGLSKDKKPKEYVGNGSIFFEMDTCKVFIYDADAKKWREIK